MTGIKYIDDYLELVRNPDPDYPVCIEQIQLADLVEKAFREENIFLDSHQAEKYLDLQKYFPFKLFPWEVYIFTLHNCTYCGLGILRWPNLFIMVGRGAGKNGYISFEGFALTTPVNGIPKYHIDIFATSEDQAKTSPDEIREDVLEKHKSKMLKHFHWTKEIIENTRTGSMIRFRTSNPSSKDGGRPGMIIFDEFHQYENYKLITVARTGKGKKKQARETIITTNGDVRDGPLDHTVARAEKILRGEIPDNGMLPFICRLGSIKQIDDQRNWHMANPSLRYFPDLLKEMQDEYEDYKLDNMGNASFVVKRMNLNFNSNENPVTDWDNIMAASKELPEVEGWSCIGAVDFAKVNDFVASGLLFEKDEQWFWKTHTWVCKQSKYLQRIQYPIEDAERHDLLTIVDEVEIPPECPAEWLATQGEIYNIFGLSIDNFRFALLKKTLAAVGFDADKNGRNNIRLIRPSDIMKIAPVVISQFSRNQISWGDNSLMRWYTNNANVKLDSKGNIQFGKIEPKSRKTDGFMAMVLAACRIDEIEGYNNDEEETFMDTFIF